MVLGFAFLTLLGFPFESWKEEINLQGFDAEVWYSGDCPQFVFHLPSESGEVGDGILLHTTSRDSDLHSARLHWEALKNLPKGKRELFFVVTCGGAATATFVHTFLKPLEGFAPELSTAEKVVISRLGNMFPGLRQARFVWNEGPWWDTTSASPWIIGPVGISQRGLWSGEVRLRILQKSEGGPAAWAMQNALIMEIEDLLEKSMIHSPWSLRSLHFEQEKLVSLLSRSRSLWDRFLDYFFERRFFFDRGWEWMLRSLWEVTEVSDFDQNGEAVLRLEYYFLGAQQPDEIQRDLRRLLENGLRGRLGIEVQTTQLSPFLRSIFEGPEAQKIERALERVPNLIPLPVIVEQVTESRFFREAGYTTYDFTPLRSQTPFFQEISGNAPIVSAEEWEKSVEFEAELLRELVK